METDSKAEASPAPQRGSKRDNSPRRQLKRTLDYYETEVNDQGLCDPCACAANSLTIAAATTGVWISDLGSGRAVEEGLRVGCILCSLVWQQLDLNRSKHPLDTYEIGLELDGYRDANRLKLLQTGPSGLPVLKQDYLELKRAPFEKRSADELWDELWDGIKTRAAATETSKAYIFHAADFASFANDIPEASPRTHGKTIQSPNKTLMWETARVNLAACDSQHDCRADPVNLPTRLLDLGEYPWIKLVETNGENRNEAFSFPTSHGLRYAALSYCWGYGTAFRTTASTITDMMIGFFEDSLPLTIRESVCVTRELGIRYLWVDALCIIQRGDPGEEADDTAAAADFAIESGRMQTVYGGAYITIVAAASSNTSGGLLDGKPTCIIHNRNDDAGVDVMLATTNSRPTPPLNSEPISSRAWAFQEWYLSPRLLLFASTGPHLVCHHFALPKSTHGVVHGSFGLRLPKTQEEANRRWSDFVVNFSARNMSRPSDKLPAIAGLASKLGTIVDGSWGRYLAGIWERDLPRDLAWRREGSIDSASLWLPTTVRRGRAFTEDTDTTSGERTLRERAPSWSWAAVDGPLMVLGHAESVYLDADYVSCHTVLVDPRNPFGEVISGVLTINCYYLRGRILVTSDPRVEVDGELWPYWPDDPKETLELLDKPEGEVLFLRIRRDGWIAVMVHPTQSGFYRRIGFALGNVSKPWDGEKQEFRIM
ncbi:HET-domain-containing protein [Echria macrotheca]|uniref:HET-domain-containing protein n=1 Tax=Echria macrotheca TaxID=438768 RepID=A0AAJ0B3X7_9PEZI|nr:HET-domain-containing protein [Echria macrotheca]